MAHNISLMKEPIPSFYGKYIYFRVNEYIGSLSNSARLPQNLSCSRCVLQWRYHAGNNWGIAMETGQPCLGCGAQEEFYKYTSFLFCLLYLSIGIDFLAVQILVSFHIIIIITIS